MAKKKQEQQERSQDDLLHRERECTQSCPLFS